MIFKDVTIAVLGLGEAGGAIAHDLVDSGVTVRAYDPAVRPPDSMVAGVSEADAVSGSDLVLSVNSSKASIAAFRAAADAVGAGAGVRLVTCGSGR